jgi:hypothetical protein
MGYSLSLILALSLVFSGVSMSEDAQITHTKKEDLDKVIEKAVGFDDLVKKSESLLKSGCDSRVVAVKEDLSTECKSMSGMLSEPLSFDQMEKEIVRLAGKARDNKLSIEEMTGGTFTITNPSLTSVDYLVIAGGGGGGVGIGELNTLVILVTA